MDSPFYRSQWTQPSRPARVTPVEPVQRKAKVVSIPVHFVGSETTRSASALKIQKVFRGFLVRKSVKKISSIRREVEEIEKRISQREAVESIRSDAKERLRLNETLMALLFKLDSVRGVDSGVRDLRKAVIKKAIALQERVDAIAAGNQALEVEDSADCQTLETEGEAYSIIISPDKDLIDDNRAAEIEQFVDGADPTLKIEAAASDVKDSAEVVTDHDFSEKAVDEADAMQETKDDDEKMDVAEVGVDSEVKADEEDCVVKQIVEDQNPTLPELEEEIVETDPTSSSSNPPLNSGGVGDENESEKQKDGGDERKRNTELLERMMEENQKMMSLMTQLFERNEEQTRMLSSLTRRVEQMERAFVCDRLRRKKKRCAVGTVDGLESTTPDQDKCGKR